MKSYNQSYIQSLRLVKARLIITIGSLLLLPAFGCKKLVEVSSPVTSTSSANAYATDPTAAAVLTGIYTNISSKGIFGGLSSTSLYLGLCADEFDFYPSAINFLPFYQNNLSNSNLVGGDFWSAIYPVIFTTNAAIEGLTNNSNLTPTVDQQLLGEAKFIRAFCYFYLVNIYGDVPLVTSTAFAANSTLSRTPKEQVYQQIIADCKDAQGLLSDHYVDATVLNPTVDRLRPTKWAATALLARTYLYTKDWADAETASGTVINNTTLFSLSPLNSAFLENSKEAIWQLQPTTANQNTADGVLFLLPATGPNNSNFVYLNKNLVNSFETGDNRFTSWVNSVTVNVGTTPTTYYYAYKYKVNTAAALSEYEMFLRVGEQFLIRAEARAQQNKLSDAAADLDAVRTRAGLAGTAASTQGDLLNAILHERQVELFTEMGHRWLDLKRTATIDAVMTTVTPQKGGVWNTQKQFFPLPLTDLQRDPNLIQNPGY